MRKSLSLVVFVALISFALGGVAVASHDFTDVPDSNPFHDDISWMASTGITTGFPDGTFRSGQAVTRQSMAAFMRRLAGDDPEVAPVVNAAELAGRTPEDYDNAVTLNGRTPADFDDAVTLNGRTPADYDDAVSLNGRTPADYDNAVTLNGRTPADFDDAVSLNGRTPADFDDAVSLNGRTPTDYDDAVTLQGNTPADLVPDTFHSTNAAAVNVTGTDIATDTVIDSLTVPAGDYLFSWSAVADSSFDSGLLSCRLGLLALPGVQVLKVGDNTVGYSDRVNISGVALVHATGSGAITVECFHASAVGSGGVGISNRNLVALQTENK